MKVLQMEFYKLKRRKIWLAPLLMLTAQLLWGLWSFSDMSAKELSQGWANILYNFPMLNAMMTPVIAAVIASRAADIEHKGNTYKLLQTVASPGRLFDAKLLCAAGWLTAAIVLQTVTITVFGMMRGFAGAPPVDEIALYFVSTLAVSLTILLFQLILSMLVPNQMIGMILGLVGAFIGLFSLFFPQSFQKLLIWAYYGVLYTVRMDWDRATRVVDYYFVRYDSTGLLCICLFFIALYAIGRRLFIRKEV
ncbi:ABC transporter permease [Agathobaculum sp. NTUH-O15-33]|uniref:ABC transporter permease n=1 Tax=Agathobaculum sp. NTUH-O15-33 TaxID=3079302 RepID=UPI00295844FD|nr:ABC transporter permease [Agathobaculum sp. NTUH-O15-33]WNX82996.1 ABC transporter permease [Agathobaculum sp. NTUH-O15-33]